MDLFAYFFNPLIIIPFIAYTIIPYIWAYITKKKYSIKIYSNNYNNITYDYILMTINPEQANNIICRDSHHTDKYISKNKREIIPVYEFIGSTIIIDDIYITNDTEKEDKRTMNYLLLESNDNKKLKTFMDNINIKAKKVFESIIKTEPEIFYYEEEEWKSYNLNVKKTFDNIFLPSHIKVKIKNTLESFNTSEIYDIYGIPRKVGFLFYGIPGTGKSSLSYAIANYLNYDIYNLNCNTTTDKFFEQVRKIPEKSIVVINDIDILNVGVNRETNIKDVLELSISLKDLLEVFDGYNYFKNCVVIITTNNIEKLDPALIRPGRIDHKIEFTYAAPEQIGEILALCDIKTKVNKKITTSELINNIIAPNYGNKKKIMELINNF